MSSYNTHTDDMFQSKLLHHQVTHTHIYIYYSVGYTTAVLCACGNTQI
jgi:hypothetical protein